jgi:hypothetical protein
VPGLVFVGCLISHAAAALRGSFVLADFEVFHRAAVRALAGAKLYRPAEDGFFQFKYSPAGALLFSPLAPLDLMSAQIVYGLVLAVIVAINLVLALAIVAPDFPRRSGKENAKIMGIAALATAVHFEFDLRLGQVNQVLLCAYLLAALGVRWNRPVIFAAPVALSLTLKPFAAVFVPWLLLQRRWRELALAALLALVIGVLPLVFYTPAELVGQYHGWLTRILQELAGKADLLADRNHSLAALLARYTPLRLFASSDVGGIAVHLFALLLLGSTLYWYWRRGHGLANPFAGNVAALLLAIPVLAPTYRNAFGFALPAATVLVAHRRALERLWWIALLGLVLLGGNIYDVWGRRLFLLFDDLSIVAVGGLILLVVLCLGRRRGVF